MSAPTAHVPLPDLTFRDGTPLSGRFDDVYFSRSGGIAETEYVFLQGNRLSERFTGQKRFSIGELGFGTGLNFLVAWREWLRVSDPGAQLHYISFEKYPLTSTMLKSALTLQPELKEFADQLISAYPLRLPGFHRLHLPRVTLTLGFGDVADLLPQLDTAIDAWFLDGFAPAKNADMWDDAILTQIGHLSAPGATFATFTAAGAVRRGLAAQGFTVEKIPGFGSKREMLVGQRSAPLTRNRIALSTPPDGRGILIVGAGIAGATAARALAERGYTATVLERGAIANGASGNEAAVLFPQLTKRWTPAAVWYFTAYSYILQQLKRWQVEGLDIPHTQCGMLRLPRHAEEETQLRTLNETLGLDPTIVHWLERDNASANAGIRLPSGAAYFLQGTWLNPARLCAALLQHENITVHTHTAVSSLTRRGGQWRATTAAGSLFEAAHCILATAQDTAMLAPQYGLKLSPVAGQVSLFTAADAATPLRSILCRSGYIIPVGEHILVGATYNHPAPNQPIDEHLCAVTTANHAHNQHEVEALLPGWLKNPPIAGRTSLRATTPDRLPYVGQLEEGLWITAGHGSRGMLSAPLAAEVLASAIHSEPTPVTAALMHAVSPSRFKKA